MVKKVQVPVVGGLRKVIIPGGTASSATTIAGLEGTTLTLSQLATLLANLENTGGGNIGTGAEAAIAVGPGLSGGGSLVGTVTIRLTAPAAALGIIEDGAPGDDGPPGPAGKAGATGAQGPSGPGLFIMADDGADGDLGPPGPPGPLGATGPQGSAGSQGPAGPGLFIMADDGADGDLGPPGPPGPLGATGAQGTAGAQGAPGAALFLLAEDGLPGDDGRPGPAGAAGAAGTAGTPGLNGAALFMLADDGIDGDMGVPGLKGATGAQGPAGSSGGGGGSGLIPDEPMQDDGMMEYRNNGPQTFNGPVSITAPLGQIALNVVGFLNASSIAQGGVNLTQTGSFTGTLTGVSAVTTGTVNYVISGLVCTLTFPAGFTGTSNNNSLTMTGLPAQCQPNSQDQFVACAMEDNGSNVYGSAFITHASGTVSFSRGVVSGTALTVNSAGFTTTGAKGLNDTSITYSLF